MEKKKDRRSVIFATSVYCLVIGVSINVFLAGYGHYAFVFSAIGILGILYNAATWSKYDLIFRNLGLGTGLLYPILKTKYRSGLCTVYKFTLPPGISVADIEKKKEHIEQHIGRSVDIKYINKGLFVIEEYRSNKQNFFDFEPLETKANIPVVIGRDKKGRQIWFELASSEPHMLIAGTTGCGKSTALRSIVTNLILTTNVNLHLIDLKRGVELAVFSKSSHVKSFARTIEEAGNVLGAILIEIERRYDLFYKHSVNDIQSYNKRFKTRKLRYEVLIIDEMVDLQQNPKVLAMIEVIGAKARACGIHMILSTQRPDKDILNGRIKTNVANVLGLKTKDGINSKIVIDQVGLEDLKGKGHGMLWHGGELTEVQTPYIDVKRVQSLIEHTYMDKANKHSNIKDNKTIDIDISDMEVFR